MRRFHCGPADLSRLTRCEAMPSLEHVGERGGGILWCNARTGAPGLYERGGMQPWGGEVWEEPHIGPHVVMWRNIL